MLTEYHTHKMAKATKRSPWNALKFGTSGEVNSQEGRAPAEDCIVVPPNCSEFVTLQGELNGALGEALIPQPPQQCLRTKLIFDVRINYPFLD